VLFTRLCKYDGQKTGILSARDFHQIAGRAGRKGFDDRGWVVAQAPEHVIENLKLAEKTARDGKKTVKRQPPEKNFVNWDKNTFLRLIAAPPERLTSRFQVTHGMLLNVLSRKGDGCRAMQQLIARCHETPRQKQAHIKRAWQLFRSLLDRKIVEFIDPGARLSPAAAASNADQSPVSEGGERTESQSLVRPHPAPLPQEREQQSDAAGLSGTSELASTREQILPLPGGEGRGEGERKLRVNIGLQEDFSMDQALSLYLLDTIPLVDPQQPDYALILLTLVESILEDPDIILRKQLDRVKDQKMAEMKMEGLDYDQRMEELEKLEYPKPNQEFIYSTFNAFADRHPWVGQENIRPKSIAREMFESFRSFSDYIRDYELQRAEGVLLRHLNRVYKVLAQNVPDAAKNDQIREMELYLGSMIRQVDSSLLDEWEKMRDPNFQRAETKEVRPPGTEAAAQDITRDTKTFKAAIRNRIFVFLRGLVIADYEAALGSLLEGRVSRSPETGSVTQSQGLAELAPPKDADGQPWTADRLRAAMEAYELEHERICLDPNARNARHTYVTPTDDQKSWRVQQMLVDPEEANDWVAEFKVDLAQSRILGEPFLQLRRIGSLV
jgi:hypothetical protein